MRVETRETDVMVLIPGNHRAVFQGLGADFAAIEPPALAGLFVNYIRRQGYGAEIIDAPGLGMAPHEVAYRVRECNPHLAVIVVYGHQPSASTQNMPAARALARAVKIMCPEVKIMMTGTHPAALPKRTLEEEWVDFVCDAEGPYTIRDTVEALKTGLSKFDKVGNLWYKDDWGNTVQSPKEYPLIQDLDEELPGIAWELLPMEKYRAHNWHCFENLGARSPYASLHTTFGCPYKCSFCCINAPFGKASYRMFSAEYVAKEIDILVEKYGIRNIKFIDEMFVLNRQHVESICDRLIERRYDLNIWAYARIDTTDRVDLRKMRKAGFRWLALGIESGSKHVRESAEKKFRNKDIIEEVRKIQDEGLYVVGNYIFGLPDDTMETMQETLDMAQEINAEWPNYYSAMAYPGAPLYKTAKEKGWALPDDPEGPGWIGYSQHAYETLPLPTDALPAKEVLRFRDAAFRQTLENPNYRGMIQNKFGPRANEHIKEILKVTLKRKLLGE